MRPSSSVQSNALHTFRAQYQNQEFDIWIQSIELIQISSVIHALRSVCVHMHADLQNLIMCAALCNVTTARIKVISPIITGPLWTPLQPLFSSKKISSQNRYTHCPILTIVCKADSLAIEE